jgi:PST family polysaccharide transporter
MALARLLGPKEFGLVGMATAFTGILVLFRDFGLSSAAIQRATVTEEQISTLFWINVAVGGLFALLAVGVAPAIAALYHEPRLFAITAVLAAGFLFNAAGVQHGALLQRQMRFTALAVINTLALLTGSAVGIGAALAGFGYWALVAMTVTSPLVSTIGFWLTTRWAPGRPRRGVGVVSMLRFGGAITLNGVILYVASNMEKVLLGRAWGADVLGIYGRAYQLITIPTDNLNSAAGEVAFAALSRLQHEPGRLRSYFLKGYSLVLGLTLPITALCVLFADDVIMVALGPKWTQAAMIFRLLAPTVLVFAIANPLGWLLCSLGLVQRALKMGAVISPLMIVGYLVGLPYGAKGVAIAYSSVMLLWVIPVIAWSVHGTAISLRDVLGTVWRPLGSSIIAGCAALVVRTAYAPPAAWERLAFDVAVVFVTYAAVLLFIAGQKAMYLDLVRAFLRPAAVERERALSV